MNEYDSPFVLNLCDITTKIAKNIDEMSWQAVQRVGINVDKEKLLSALKQDAERYREAYARGREAGYTKRDKELVRCEDCQKRYTKLCGYFYAGGRIMRDDWFCADGERREDED